MIVCNKCGARNDDENLYCISCHQLFRKNDRQSDRIKVEQSAIKSLGTTGGPVEPKGRSGASARGSDPGAASGDPYRKQSPRSGNRSAKDRKFPDASKIDNDEPTATKSKYSLLNKVFGVLFVITVPSMLYLGYFILNVSTKVKEEAVKPLNTKASSMFVEAENHFNGKRYLAAQNLYIRFMDEFPDDPLAEIVSERIRQINNGLLTVEEESIYKKHRLKLLLERVEIAFEKGQYVRPINDNVMSYVTEILALDPENNRARSLREQVIRSLDSEGRRAFAQDDLERARGFFESLLLAVPGHRGARIQLDRIKAAIAEREAREKARISDSLRKAQKPTQPVFASTAIPAGQDFTPPAETVPPSGESRTSPETDNGSGHETGSTGRQSSPVGEGGNGPREEDRTVKPVQVDVSATPSRPAAPAETSPPPVFHEPVIESFLDGGQRDYIVKTTPEYPRKLRKTGLSGTVLMEVVVRKDGRVANYRVLQSEHEAFTEECIKALRGFRYRPGTINNVPVSFKVIERFEFKVVD